MFAKNNDKIENLGQVKVNIEIEGITKNENIQMKFTCQVFENCAFDGILGLNFINYFMSVIDLAHGILTLRKQNKQIRHKFFFMEITLTSTIFQ